MPLALLALAVGAFGIGMFLGNLLGGRLADRTLMPMPYVTLGGLAVVLALCTPTAHSEILAAITIVLAAAALVLAFWSAARERRAPASEPVGAAVRTPVHL